MTRKKIGLIGARGYVGNQLLRLLDDDDCCEVAFVSSKGAAGKTAAEAIGAIGRAGAIVLEDLAPADVAARDVDGVVLGLSNGQSAPWVAALPPRVRVVDLSADHRFVDSGWVYGLTETRRAAIREAQRTANPGCYATAAQLALWPLRDLVARAHVFGVSGYSGAGNTPSSKNDLTVLRDNLLPYDIIGHTQEREMARHTGVALSFLPHVASFFRGITVTLSLDMTRGVSTTEAFERLAKAYDREPLIALMPPGSGAGLPPLVSQVRERNGVVIGGLHADEGAKRLVVVATLDNLLKGAATQALQNLHLMLGLPELSGITP